MVASIWVNASSGATITVPDGTPAEHLRSLGWVPATEQVEAVKPETVAAGESAEDDPTQAPEAEAGGERAPARQKRATLK